MWLSLTGLQIQTNSFDRTDTDTGQAGIFLHPALAMVSIAACLFGPPFADADVENPQINHSCIPNAAVSFSGRKAFLRAELPIKEGDEITISYIGIFLPTTSNSGGYRN